MEKIYFDNNACCGYMNDNKIYDNKDRIRGYIKHNMILDKHKRPLAYVEDDFIYTPMDRLPIGYVEGYNVMDMSGRRIGYVNSTFLGLLGAVGLLLLLGGFGGYNYWYDPFLYYDPFFW